MAPPSDTLSVLIDARKINHGGIGVYTKNLIAGLLNATAHGTPLRISLLVAPGTKTEFSGSVEEIEEGAKLYSWNELFRLGRRISAQPVHLFHAPHYTLPRGIAIPSVVTIHDTIHVHSPERWFYPFIARPLIRSAVKRATRVIAVSESTKRDLTTLCKLSNESSSKISVVPNAMNAALLKATLSVDELRKKFQLPRPFALAVISTSKPHKGLADLIYAWREVRQWETSCDLVIVGEGLYDMPQFERVDGVRVLGRVSTEVLAALYRGAAFLAVPSTAEGFCLPALEAKSFGRRMVVRPVPALQELAGPRDVIAEDFSVPALTNALLTGVREGVRDEDDTFRAEQFSVDAVTQKVLQVYQEATSFPLLSRAVAATLMVGGV